MANNNSNKKNGTGVRISSAEDFKRLNRKLKYDIVHLYDWDETTGQEYKVTVKVRKLSMATIIESGAITNSLMKRVMSLTDLNRENDDKAILDQMTPDDIQASLNMMREMAAKILVEPAWEDVKEDITDNQIAQLVQYLQGGVQALNSFRNEQKSIRFGSSSEGMESKTI